MKITTLLFLLGCFLSIESAESEQDQAAYFERKSCGLVKSVIYSREKNQVLESRVTMEWLGRMVWIDEPSVSETILQGLGYEKELSRSSWDTSITSDLRNIYVQLCVQDFAVFEKEFQGVIYHFGMVVTRDNYSVMFHDFREHASLADLPVLAP